MKKLLIILVALSLGCSEMYVVPEDQYVIEAGKHDSRIVNGSSIDKIRTLKSNNLVFTARFDQTARYNLNNNDQYDINKLMGFSEANSLHHDNSARFGWRYNIENDNIEIFSYIYREGELSYNKLSEVAINETIEYQINLFDNEYEFVINGFSYREDRRINQEVGIYYRLFPYFGGDEVAPHDINIYIKEVF